MKVNLNDIKKFVVPDSSEWKLNSAHVESAVDELGCAGETPVILDFRKLDTHTLDNIAYGAGPKLFIIPDWPCMAWYKPLHDLVDAEAVQLPDMPDLFLDEKGNPLGSFAWKHWLFCCK